MISTNEIEIFGMNISGWVYGPVIFVLWLIAMFSTKTIFFRWIRKWGEKTQPRYDEFLVKSLNVPVNVLIFAGGLGLLGNLLPLPVKFDQPISLSVRVLIILAVFFIFDRLVTHLLRNLASKIHGIDLTRGNIQNLVRLIILSCGLLILLDALGISITPLVASLGIGSLAVALGLQETLANFFAGIYILVDQPVRVGDFIRLESGEEGYVTDIGWRNTRILMLPNLMVILPNNKIISSTIRNYYLPNKELAALVEVGVHYASDLKKVERITVEVAREIQKSVTGAVPTFEPFIRYHTFGDSSINFTVILRVKEFTDQYLIKHEFIKALQERYKKEEITIPYPIRTLDLPARTLDELSSHFQKNA